MTPKAFHALFGRIGARAKMPFPIHPHMLRHGCGYALANAGHDEDPIRKQRARGIPPAPDARNFRQGRCEVSCLGRVSGDPRATANRLSRRACSKFLRIRHIRKVERLASFRQRDPRIPQACIMFPLLEIVCFLRQRCAPGCRFPCGLALGSHVVLFHFRVPHGYGRAVDCIAQHILSTTRRRFQAPQLLPNATYWCFLDRPVLDLSEFLRLFHTNQVVGEVERHRANLTNADLYQAIRATA
jgi:hypothetical protein